MTVIIPCGGRGLRARGIVGDIPKQLFPIGDKPALGHLIDYVAPIATDIRVVANPANVELFRQFSDRYTVYEQPEPRGTADAAFYAMADLKDSKVPLLIVLGDQIPIGFGAEAFQSQLRKPPAENLIAVKEKRDLTETTWVTTKSGYIQEFLPVRGDFKVPGKHLVHAGFDYIERADWLYEAIREMIHYKHLSFNEYRLPVAYQRMKNKGSVFKTCSIQYLSVGDKTGIERTTRHFDIK